MSELAAKKCTACEGGIPPLTGDDLTPWLEKIDSNWKLIDGKKIRRSFSFDDFASAMVFAANIGQIAEEEGHHPDLHISYGSVAVEWWTHKIDGLFDNDFIMAAKTDQLYDNF